MSPSLFLVGEDGPFIYRRESKWNFRERQKSEHLNTILCTCHLSILRITKALKN